MSNWPVKTLSEVCELQRGHDLPSPKRREGKVPILGSTGITGFHDVALYAGPGVAIGRSGFIGGAQYCDISYWPLNTCLFIKDFFGNEPRWVYYFLKSIDFSKYNSGTTQPSLNRNNLANIPVVTPSLNEQKRIVELLDNATARVTELTELGSRHSKLETEMQSAIVERLLSPERGWNSRPLNEWCSEIGTGPFGSLVHKADYVETGIPLVNPINMKEGQIVESGINRVSPSKAVELNRYILKAGDIVLGRRGEMGRCAVVRSEHDGWICGTGSFFLRPNEDCSPDLLALWLSSRQGCSALCSISSGTTMDNLGNRELGLLQVAFPDRPTQDEIVFRASALEGLVYEMQIQQHDRSVLLKSLQQSILEAAFAGQL